MRKEPIPGYEAAGEGKCWEMFHPELRNGPYCYGDLGHDGSHNGFNMTWEHEPQVDVKVAERFVELYRKIPNGSRDIWLNDDGTVGMTLSGMADAVRFIHLHHSVDA